MPEAIIGKCKACSGPTVPMYEGLSDRMHSAPGTWSMRRCANHRCGLLMLDPEPTDEQLAAAYENYYTHDVKSPAVSLRRRWLRACVNGPLVLLGIMAQRRRLEAMDLQRVEPGRLLELGCGDSNRLRQLQGMGWVVEGQEVDPVSARLVRLDLGVPVHEGTLESLDLPANSYDAIVMNHVIEHVRDPSSLVAECGRLLKSGGHFVAITPNASSRGHTRFKSNWRDLDPPRHLVLFSPKNVRAFFHAATWAQIDVRTSAARASEIIGASLQIERTGRHSFGGHPLRVGLQAMEGQFAASFSHVFHRETGEELIVHARRR